MRGRPLMLLSTLALLLAACGDSASSGPPGGGKGPGATPTTLLQAVYYLDHDSSRAPKPGSVVTLFFEPGGVATLLLARPDGSLGHHGTWKYQSGKLNVKFSSGDFHPDTGFDLDLANVTPTMPFQVFSSAAGTSNWKRGALSIVSGSMLVARAAATDPENAKITPAKVTDEAFAYAKARVDAGGDNRSNIIPAARRIGRGQLDAAPPINGVVRLGNGIRIDYEDRPSEIVTLYDWAADASGETSISPGPLAKDPRVHLNVKSPGDSSNDPATKTAVFLSPFESGRFYANALFDWGDNAAGSLKQVNGFNWSHDASQLTDAGYTVTQLMDEKVTVPAVIDALGGKSGKAPGLVIFNTHGGDGGNLTLGLDLGKNGTPDVDKNWSKAIQEIKDAGYGDLLKFGGGNEFKPATLLKLYVSREGATDDNGKDIEVPEAFMAITPSFWKWLQTKGADFSHSLVYVAACNTESDAQLHDAVHARAYLAWSGHVSAKLVGAVGNYMIDDMVRPTHSAEEAFYNIVRVVNTRQEIYKEDADLQQAIPTGLDKGTKFVHVLAGYGYDGSTMVPYNGTGWLTKSKNAGQVWWQVFVGRWGQDAATGSAQLVSCWNRFWVDKKRAGLADPYCNTATSGDVPIQEETAYATYLLTGKPGLALVGGSVPRMTLNDGRSP